MNTRIQAQAKCHDDHADFSNIRIIDDITYMARSAVQALTDKINREFVSAVSRSLDERNSPYWAGLAAHGIPSPYIRADGNIMEIEAGPDGTVVQDQILNKLAPNDAERFRSKLRDTLQLSGCKKCVQFGEIVDDSRFAEIIDVPYEVHHYKMAGSLNLAGLNWIRSDAEIPYSDVFYDQVDRVSLIPNRDNGNKDYLRHMGITMSLHDYGMRQSKLPWHSGFVLKPGIHAARARGVVVYRGNGNYKSIAEEADAKKRVNSFLRDNSSDMKSALIQKLIPAASYTIDGTPYFAIPRLFFVWDFKHRRYEFLAGLMNASTERDVIHGNAPNACFWPVLIR